MSKPTTLAKPTLANKSKSEAALEFAEAGAPDQKTSVKQAAGERRVFYAPEGYRRLTINLDEDLHKKLRLKAVEQDCTVTDIIVELVKKELAG